MSDYNRNRKQGIFADATEEGNKKSWAGIETTAKRKKENPPKKEER